MHITGALSTPVLKKAIDRYYKELDEDAISIIV